MAEDLVTKFFGNKPENTLTNKFFPNEEKQLVTKFFPEKPKNILDPYRVEEKTPEQLKSMSLRERMDFAQDVNRFTDVRKSSGFVKGLASGATLSGSEYIPGLKPNEEDLNVGIGNAIGAFLPVGQLFKVVGKPLVTLASKSPVARKGLESLARMTGFGLTGATYKAGQEIVQGELPDPNELLKEGAVWTAIDAGMQALGVGAAFGQSVRRIAEEEGVTAREVLGKLWESTKNFTKQKFGRTIKSAKDITPQDVEILVKEAEAKAESIVPKEGEILDVTPSEQMPISPISEIKPIQQIEVKKTETTLPKVDQSNWTTLQKQMYDELIDSVKQKTSGSEVDQYGYGLAPLDAIYDNLALLHFLKPSEAKKFKELAEKEKNKVEEVSVEDKKPKYDRKPEPKTVPEKISHLKQKIDESRKFITDLRSAIVENKNQLALAKEKHKTITDPKEKRESELKIYNLNNNLVSKRESLKSELKYVESLKKDFTDLKKNKESSKVQVPLGRQTEDIPKKSAPLNKKSNVRPNEGKLAEKKPVVGKKQAVARSKIIDTFRKAFKDPIRFGKIGNKKALGIHKMWPKVTRLLKANDIETAAHEIGHNLHTILYEGNAKNPKEQRENVNKSLAPYLGELKPLALYEPYGLEGFAEFTRIYVTNPDEARMLAPKFYQKFENDLDAIYPELKIALLEARDYYDTYLQGTPQSRIRAQTSYGDDVSKLKSMIDWVKDKGNIDNLKTQFLDDVFPAKRLVAQAFGIPLTEVENLKDPRNLYRSLRVLKGAIGKADVYLMHETFNALTLDKINGSLRDILKQLPDEESYREFNDYLIARRSIEKQVQGIETGINVGDALIVEGDLSKKYHNLAQELDRYNDTVLRYAVDSGMISESQYKKIKENNLLYTPFQRVMEKEKVGASSTTGKLQAKNPIKRMKGSSRDIIPPIESIIKNTYTMIINAEKNLAGKTLAELSKMKDIGAYVERVPTPVKMKAKILKDEIEQATIRHLKKTGQTQFLQEVQDGDSSKIGLIDGLEDILPDVIMKFGATQYPPGENIITVYEKGKPTYYEVSPEIFDMWNKGMAPYTANLLTKILRVPARTLRAGAIFNPKFMQKNIVRDTWGSWLFTKYGKSIKDPGALFIDTIYSPLAMLAQSAKKGDLYVEWLKSGGGMSTMQGMDRDNIIKKLHEVRKGYKPTQVIKWLRQVAEISEEANRLSEFGKALEVEGKTRIGREIAAFASRDLSIDFAKMGLQVKMLNQIIPFFNATIQGGDKLVRTIVNPEDRKNLLPRAIGFVLLPALVFAWLNKDDERMDEFYEEEKDFNFITFIGNRALKIPVPFETGVILNGLTTRMYNYFMKKDPKAFEGFMGSILSAMLPNVLPAFANPLIEAQANKNFFTGAPIIPRAKENLISKYQYKNNSSSTARLLGRAIAYMIGEETRAKAASPAVIDHFVNAWGGGLGKMAVSILDAGLEASGLSDKIPGPHQPITEKLGLDAFTVRFPRASTRSIEKFYDYYADATTRQKSINYAKKHEEESPEKIQEAYVRMDALYNYKDLQRAYKAMQMNQRAINEIWVSKDISPEEKREMIDDLYMQQIEFAKDAVESAERHREK